MWTPIDTLYDDQLLCGYDGLERRHKPRIIEPFFTRVRGIDASGEAFEANTLLDNISASGLYMRLGRQVNPEVRLFVVIHFPTCLSGEGVAGRAALLGIVLRSEPRSGGLWGLAIRFTRYRFL
jgi:hypothetical protein